MKIQSAQPSISPASLISNKTLVMTRWLAVAGQSLAILTAHYILDINLPIFTAFACIFISAMVNIFSYAVYGPRGLSPSVAFSFIVYDVFQLTALLWLTGGINNPFSILLLAPLAVGATFSNFKKLVFLVALAISCTIFLTFYHLPMDWPKSPDNASHPPLYIPGLLVATTLTIIFTCFYVWRLSMEARSVDKAYQITQMALAREHESASLGALAAATAHELGSPLTTISVISKELVEKTNNHNYNNELKDDIYLLHEQVRRCQNILKNLGKERKDQAVRDVDHVPAKVLVSSLCENYQSLYPDISYTFLQDHETAQSPNTYILKTPELEFAIGNILHNAFKFASSLVEIQIIDLKKHIDIIICDDGPGFTNTILRSLGEPYINQLFTPPAPFPETASEEKGLSGQQIQNGLGLGVFIAQTLLQRYDSRISFTNRQLQAGAEVTIRLQRDKVAIHPT